MQTLKPKKRSKQRAESTHLSPKELRLLADKLVAAKNPAEVARLKDALERGFYGDPEHA